MAWWHPEIRPGERRNTLGAFLILFGAMAGHSLLETARDALFLAEIAASRLPLVYLTIAILALWISSVQQKDRQRTGRGTFSFGLWVAAVITAGFWLLVDRGGHWVLYALYVWSGLLSTLLIVRFWIIAGELFTVTQAKRLFAFIGTGSILGAVTGSAFAQRIVMVADSAQLLLGASLLLFATGFAPAILTRPEEESRGTKADSEPPDTLETLRAVWRHPYARRIGGLVLGSTLTFTLVDFVFKTAVAEEFSAAELGWVFATTYLVLNLLSLLAQFLLVGWVTRRLGVDRMLSMLPALLALGSVWLVAGGGALAAFVLKGFDGSLRHSLHRTATEVLYVPISRARRARIKSFIDVVGQRGGQAVASILFLGLVAVAAPPAVVGALLVVLCAAWVGLAVGLKRHYFDLFRDTLQEGAIRTRIDFPEMDLESLESLMAALSSPDEREVVAALDLLAEKDRVRLVPALILYHPSPRVVVRALQLFAREERTDHLRLVERLHDHEDPTVRVSALLATPAHETPTILENALEDESPDVRATALVGLLSATDDVHPRIRSILDTMIEAGSSASKQALVRAIAHRPGPRFDEILKRLAESGDPEVARVVAQAMRMTPKPEYLDALLPMLQWRESRADARTTLTAIGAPAFESLAAALVDESVDPAVRRHLPRTICLFEPDRAGRVLLERLAVEPDGVTRYKLLRALGSLRAKHSSVRLDARVLDHAIEDTLRAILRLVDWRATLVREARAMPHASTPVRQLIVEMLDHKERHAIERLFRLLSLRYPKEDLKSVHRGISAGGREAKASARELLELVLKPPLGEAVLGLLDDVPDGQRLATGARYYQPTRMTHEDVLRSLLDRGSIPLKSLAAYHVAELALDSLRDDLLRAYGEATGVMQGSLRNAIEMLDDPGGERAFVVSQ